MDHVVRTTSLNGYWSVKCLRGVNNSSGISQRPYRTDSIRSVLEKVLTVFGPYKLETVVVVAATGCSNFKVVCSSSISTDIVSLSPEAMTAGCTSSGTKSSIKDLLDLL